MFKRLTERRPILFSVLATVVFVVAIVLISFVGALTRHPAALEAVGAVGRGGITVLAAVLLSRVGAPCARLLRFPREPRAWLIGLLPLLYVVVAYPLLFTGRLSLNLSDPVLAASVGANGFSAGVVEEAIFRGIILCVLTRHWGVSRKGLVRVLLATSALFSLPHALNVFAGADPLRVLAQLVWAVLLGIVFAALVLVSNSIWPAAVVHGVANAVVHVNRLGVAIEPSGGLTVLMALAPLPLVVYAILLLRRGVEPRSL